MVAAFTRRAVCRGQRRARAARPAPQTDLCANGTQLYFHPVCITGAAAKKEVFQAVGHFFLDSPADGGCTDRAAEPISEGGAVLGGDAAGAGGGGAGGSRALELKACKPLAWRRPEVEVAEGQPCPGLAFRGSWRVGEVRGSGPLP